MVFVKHAYTEAAMYHSKITRTPKNGDGEIEFLVVTDRGLQSWTAHLEEGTSLTLEDKRARLTLLQGSEASKEYTFDDTGINE